MTRPNCDTGPPVGSCFKSSSSSSRIAFSITGSYSDSWRDLSQETSEVTSTSLMLVVFLEGRVPCFKWACVLRKSGQSVCMANQADLVVKGKRVWLSMISWTCTDLTTESSNCVMNEQIWQQGSVHSDALRLAKSDGIFTEPLRCLTLLRYFWYLLTVDRNDVTRGLAENSPLQSFSTACTQGLLSVNKQVLCVDWIM